MIFDYIGSGEMLDFSGFCRSRYRSGCFGGFEVKCLGNADFIGVCGLNRYAVPGNRQAAL